jgi:tetratricopeptide (TPR) repeat protein
MDVKERIKSLLQQADIYQAQGLLNEAKDRYMQAGQIIKQHEDVIRNKSLLSSIAAKVRAINDDMKRLEESPLLREMPEQVQEVIRTKFSFSKDDNLKDMEGAIALAKFGQYKRALREFNELLSREDIRMDVAKNIFRCHMAMDLIEDAAVQYEQWMNGNLFSVGQLGKLRFFLQNILEKKGIDRQLPMPDDPGREKEVTQEEILDISSVGITISEGVKKGETIEYDVSFQSGNVINILISSTDKYLLEHLDVGITLDQVQFYSPMAMFNGKAVVSAKSKIESGPKQGYYSLDIKIKSI